MTYRELYDKATRQLEKSEITFDEYMEMTKALNEEIEDRKVGKWIEFPVNRFSRCSNCGFESAWDYTNVKNWNCCPNCGAKMDKE